MQIEELSTGDSHSGTPYYFSAILFEDWEFWTAGPSSHIRENVLIELMLYQSVSRVQLVKVYVPHVQ